MKYTKIRLKGPSDVDLPIENADLDGPYVFKGADGVGPPAVDVSITQTRQLGGVYQGRQPQGREVVIRVGLQPAWNTSQTPDDLRKELYGLLTPRFGEFIKVQFINGTSVVAEAEGHISKMEPAIFSKDPEVLITIACLQPYFYAPAIQYQTPAKVIDEGNTNFNIVNEGDAPSGFWLGMTFTADVTAGAGVVFTDDASSPSFMDVNRAFSTGDTLIIDTRYGSRGVWRIPNGSGIAASILNDLTESSDWFQLHGGTNVLHVNNTAFNWYASAVGLTPAYWGA